MARAKKTTDVQIEQYLVLMFMLESAMNGFMRWAYERGDAFDAGLYQSLDTKHGEQKRREKSFLKPTLGNLEKYLKDARDVKTDDKIDRSAMRKQDDLLYAVNDLLKQRNSIMHGGRPTLPLLRTPTDRGLVRKAAVTFYLVRNWIIGWNRELAKTELFEGWRYLWLTEEDILAILDKGEIESRELNLDGNDLKFYRRPLFGGYTPEGEFSPSEHGALEVWVASSRFKPQNLRLGQIKKKTEIEAKDQWKLTGVPTLLEVTGSTPEAFRWIPTSTVNPAFSQDGSSGDHLFSIPAWTFAKAQEDRLCLLVQPSEPAAEEVRTRAPRRR